MKTYSPGKQIYYYSIIFLIVILVVLLAGEVFIRLTRDYYTPEINRQRSLEYEPAAFSRTVFPLREQYIEHTGISVNSKGYRGPDFTVEKPEGTIRIIVYGGSAVFDQNMVDGEDWPSRVQAILNSNESKNIEVINAGIPGHTSFDSFGRLFTEGHVFQPDIVILYNAWNDIKHFSTQQPLLRTAVLYDKSLEFRSYYRGTADKLLSEVSQLYVRLRSLYFNWKYDIGAEGYNLSGDYTREVTATGTAQYQLTIETFVDIARNIKATPILTTQARLVSGNNTSEEKALIGYQYQKMTHETLVNAYKQTDEIMRSVAESKQVPIIDLSKDMTGENKYFDDHVHLNQEGSARVAAIVARFLEAQIQIGK